MATLFTSEEIEAMEIAPLEEARNDEDRDTAAEQSIGISGLPLFTHEEIQALEISPFHGSVLSAGTGGGNSDASVDAGEISCFVDGLNLQQKQDVLNSTLLAQLNANKLYNRDTQMKEWYITFVKNLQGFAWEASEFKFVEHEIGKVPVTVDKIVLSYMKTYLNPDQLSRLNSVVNYLRGRGDDDRDVRLFTTESSKEALSNFQMGVCIETKEGDVMCTCGAFYYSTKQKITNALFTDILKGSAQFMNAYQVMILKETKYAKIRASVIQKLGDYAKKLIDDLPDV